MILYVTKPGSQIVVKNKKILIEKDGETVIYPIGVVEAVFIEKNVHMDSKDIYNLSEKNITVSWIDNNIPLPYIGINNDIERMKKQFLKNEENQFNLSLSKKLIKSKIHNQYALLNKNGIKSDDKNAVSECDKCTSLDSLRGIEGINARYYFRMFSELLPEKFRFKHRTRRPAEDFANSCLNYLYTLLYRKCSIIVAESGLCQYIGFMHQIKNGHMSLVSDFIEPFRSVLADEILLKLFSKIKYSESISDLSVNIPYEFKKNLIKEFEDKCNSFCKTINGYKNTFNEKMKEQIYSYIKAIENDNTELFVPFTC